MAPADGPSEQQIAAAVAAREEWARTALSTEPCDRAAAEVAVRRVHRLAGLPDPVVVWAGSPLSGAIADAVLGEPPQSFRVPTPAEYSGPAARPDEYRRHFADLREQPASRPARRLRPGFEERGRDALLHASLDRADGRLHLAFPARSWAWERSRWVERLPHRLASTLQAVLRMPAGVADLCRLAHTRIGPTWGWERGFAASVPELRRELAAPGPPGAPVRAASRVHRWSRDAAADLGSAAVSVPAVAAWVRSPRPVLDPGHLVISAEQGLDVEIRRQALAVAGLPPAAGLEALAAALRAVGCWWPLRRVAVLVDRPTTIRHDRDGRLHNPTGPVVAYPDGFAAHAWHGTEVPADLVTGDGWEPARILAERNAEVRRCAIERFGWDRFAAQCPTPVGTAVPDPGNPGQSLRLYDLPWKLRIVDGRPARLLVVTNASPDRDGTRRSFGLLVRVDVPDALAAVAATFDLTPAEYASLTRAT